MTQIISVRIEDEMYEQIRELNIPITEVVRSSIKMEILKRKRELMNKRISELAEQLRGETLGNFLLTENKKGKGK
ncbi:MAG: hypothetical protein ACYCSO_06955 [Cuniculiplasma sp.]